MKRDIDALRSMLFDMENYGHHTMIVDPSLTDPKPYQSAVLLCNEGLFIEVKTNAFMMTSDGYDFLDLVRDDEVWEYIKRDHRVLAEMYGKTMTINSIRDMAPDTIEMVFSIRRGKQQ